MISRMCFASITVTDIEEAKDYYIKNAVSSAAVK